MGKRPPCVLYQSFLVLSVFVHDAPNKGTHPPVMHLTSLESHHSQDLCEAPSLAATAHGILFIPLQRSACDWTFADGRRKVKDALYYSVFKERAEAIEKAPSLSMPKS